MKRTNFDGVELEYAVEGSGEPVVLIHGSILADYLSTLRAEPTLTQGHRAVSYCRRGFGGSTHPKGPLSIHEQAADCRKLMDHLNINNAHVVGHSYGGAIAMQLAADSPEYVHSLSLLEPLLPMVLDPASPMGAQFSRDMVPVGQFYQQGNKAGAIDAFMRLVVGPDYRTWLDRILPGAFDQAVADADTFFMTEFPAAQQWRFTIEDANRIKRPVMFVGGAASVFAPYGKEIGELMTKWFPQSETIWLPAETHAFPITNPKGTCQALAGFFARYPLQIVV